MHVIRYKYILPVKFESLKVRIVALGCSQVHGVDYNETFYSVFKLTAIRKFLSTAALMDLETDYIDVAAAILNWDLDEDIYIEVADDTKDPKRLDLVWSFEKLFIYGFNSINDLVGY